MVWHDMIWIFFFVKIKILYEKNSKIHVIKRKIEDEKSEFLKILSKTLLFDEILKLYFALYDTDV